MERIFIDKDWCVTYVLLALNNLQNNDSQEITIKDFIDEVEIMSNIYTDDIEIKKIKKKLTKKFLKKKLIIN